MRTESARARAAPPSVNRVNIPERHPATGRYGSITGRDDKTRADQRTNRVGRARLVAGAGAVVAIGALVAGTIAVAGAPADEPARSEQPPQTTAASTATATATEESVATSTTSAVATESPTTSTRALPVRSVVSVGAEMQYDQLPFDPATSFGEPERFDREVAIECDEICEIVFDDAAWLWDLGLRLPIENGTVDALREFEAACREFGSAPVTVTADLAVVSTVDVDGRDVPASFSGAVVVESATVPYQTPTGPGECMATRTTIRFPATSNP